MNQSSQQNSTLPLCVDLDGTLLRTDMLYESCVGVIREKWSCLFQLPVWLLSGRARLKSELANRFTFDPALLPYNQEFLSFLKAEHEKGRSLFLTTASDEQVAEPIAAHLGIFEKTLASNGIENLKGSEKLKAIDTEFAGGDFAYAGNSSADLPIWKEAKEVLLVNASSSLASEVSQTIGSPVPQEAQFDMRGNGVRAVVRALRPHQYAKNALIFVPAITAHAITDLNVVLAACIAFLSYSACASSVYLLNDLLDLDADREHPKKRFRPLASGAMPIWLAGVLVPVLFVLSLAAALFLPPAFFFVILLYGFITTSYSFFIKRIPIADILTLAALYTLRIAAGGVATDIIISEWLLTFAVFFFFSLATAKRYAELFRMKAEGREESKRRGYRTSDLSLLTSIGVASGFVSVLVLALYFSSSKVETLYAHPDALWLTCPLMLYWITRIWLLSNRGEMDEDPVIFALKDIPSYLCGVLAVVFLLLAR